MKTALSALFTVLGAFTIIALPLHSQSRITVSIEGGATMGAGSGGVYRNRTNLNHYASVALRAHANSRVAFYADLSANARLGDDGENADCQLKPGGGCLSDYPNLSGPALTGGIILAGTNQMELRLGVGAGHFNSFGTPATSLVMQGDFGLFPVNHVGVIFGTRATRTSNFEGAALLRVPLLVGIRIR